MLIEDFVLWVFCFVFLDELEAREAEEERVDRTTSASQTNANAAVWTPEESESWRHNLRWMEDWLNTEPDNTEGAEECVLFIHKGLVKGF